jgi:hypothetical protein
MFGVTAGINPQHRLAVSGGETCLLQPVAALQVRIPPPRRSDIQTWDFANHRAERGGHALVLG